MRWRCPQARAVVLRTVAAGRARDPSRYRRRAFIQAGERHGLSGDLLGQSHSCRPAAGTKTDGKSRMRLILGIIIGGALTIGGAYVADKTAASGAQPMVNWDVVGKNVNTLTGLARDGWKKITG
jgi:hypothetical protein